MQMRVECVVTSFGRSCVREPSLLAYLLPYLEDVTDFLQ